MSTSQQARGAEDVRTLHVSRVRTSLTLNKQQHFLDAHFLSLKASRLETMLEDLNRRKVRVETQLDETREALELLLEEDRVANPDRRVASRTMQFDY